MTRLWLSIAAVMLASAAVSGAGQPDVVTVPLKPGDNAVSAAARLGGETGRGRITVNLDDGGRHVFEIGIEPDRFRRQEKKDGKRIWKDESLPDAVVTFSGLARYHSRPRLERYTSEQQEDLMKRWETLPSAPKRFIVFEARQDATGVALYLDGQYVGRRDAKGKLKSIEFLLPKEGEVRDGKSFRYYENPAYLPLDVQCIAKPGVMNDAVVSLKPGLQTIHGIPIIVAAGAGSVDVGVVKQMKGSWALECDEHLARTALDGMPETAHFSVPQATYVRAWALCAVDNAPGRDPIITARLTRFARSGRGDAVSDTTLTLPRGGEAPTSGATAVGSASYEQGGTKTTVPLYLVEFRLKPGEILDLLAMKEDPDAPMTRSPYLDFEFLGRLGAIQAQWDLRHKPDNKSTSAVHVFGVTLERSPVELRLDNGQPGNIFANDDTPEMSATLTATRGCRVALAWRIHDIGDATIREERRDLAFERPGEEKLLTIPLRTDELGWYGAELTLRDDGGRELIRHAAAFAALGKDTRQAGYESPYGTWWFAGAHYGASDKEIAGPMLFKAGLRKTTFGWTKYTEADMAPWKITLNQLGWSLAPRDMTDKQAAYDAAEKRVRNELARFPHCRSADIFHESFAHYVPPELLDEKPPSDAASQEQDRRLAALGTFAATFYRERFPDIKLLVGNTSSSDSIIASLFRGGFDAKLIDYIGVEAVGQTGMPELLWDGGTQGIWLAREVARKFGHDLPVTGCFEFTSRTERALGAARQAEWIARDMLLCHAYGFQHINPAIIHDAGNAYYNTLWGAGGLCRRNPLLYPKPAYVAVATLTKVLDRVQPSRRVATGSMTVYALEFARADGQFALALWAPRGTATLRLRYPRDAAVTRVDCYGRSAPFSAAGADHGVEVACGTAPAYVVGPSRVEAIRIVGHELAVAPAAFRVADPMDGLKRWRLEPGDDRLRNPARGELPHRVPGQFELTEAADAEKGRCLELTLRREGKVPDIVGEYTALKLAEPVPVPGTPTEIGVWVKGDSGWGKIIFEVEDAVGALWRTDGPWHDWPGDLSVCHDGWRFMSYPIDGSSHVLRISPGARWGSFSPKKRNTIQFPIKVAGLYVVMHRRALDLSEMKEVQGALRFRNIGTVE